MDEKEELQYLRQQNKKLKQENRELSSKLAVTEAAKKETEESRTASHGKWPNRSV